MWDGWGYGSGQWPPWGLPNAQGGPADPIVTFSVTTPPAREPVTPAELRTYARIDTDVDDDLLVEHIATARMEAEAYTGRALITQTITAIAEVPGPRLWGPLSQTIVGSRLYIRLPRPRVQALTSAQQETLDQPGVWTTFAGGTLDTAEERAPRFWLWDDWPEGARLKLVYTAGYGDTPDSVPVTVRQFIKRRAATLYDNRAGKLEGLSMQLLDTERVLW